MLRFGDPKRKLFGQLQIAQFSNPEGLRPLGDGLFAESDAFGAPRIANPDSDGGGKIRQGMLERANVDVQAERVELKAAQQSLTTLVLLRSSLEAAKL